VSRGDDFGWPYCYYDNAKHAKLLTPEYGGDGAKVGRCAEKRGSVAQYPGHWAPEALLFYSGSTFPAKYRRGAFIAFHGSWNRAPLPQAGYRVVFQPMDGAKTAGAYETFADGFMTQRQGARNAARRPMGLAQGADGALYVTDDAGGRIWKIVYVGK
jgi:glucose/arabinose dehydrogenase